MKSIQFRSDSVRSETVRNDSGAILIEEICSEAI